MTLIEFFLGQGEGDIRDMEEFYRDKAKVQFIIQTIVELIEVGVLKALTKAFGRKE